MLYGFDPFYNFLLKYWYIGLSVYRCPRFEFGHYRPYMTEFLKHNMRLAILYNLLISNTFQSLIFFGKGLAKGPKEAKISSQSTCMVHDFV